MTSNIQLIITTSGSSKRFTEAGYTVPKSIIDIDGKLMIQHVVELFPGVTDIIFICNKKYLDVIEALRGLYPSSKIITIDEHNKGPVYSVLQAYDYIDDNKEIIISYNDYGSVWNFSRFLLEIRGFSGAIACYRNFHPHMLGSDNYAFCKEKDGLLIKIKEKEPFTADRMSEFASNGTYYFINGALMKRYFRELLDRDININGEYYVSLVYNLLVRDGLPVKIFEIEKMLQFGTPYDLEVYRGWSRFFAKKRKEEFTLILSMAGEGRRFKDAGFDIPKPFLPIDDKPMFVKSVECLPKYKDAVFICLKEYVETVKKHYPNDKVCYVESVTEGQACTCEIGINYAGIDENEPILISACDNAMVYSQEKFFGLVSDETNDIIVWSFKNHPTSKNNPNMYSWLDVDQNGFIRDVSCKQFVPSRSHAIIGTMYFRKAKYFLDGLQSNYAQNIRTNGEFYVDDVLNQNIKSGLKLRVFEVDNYICFGTPDDYKTYNYWKDHFK